MTADIASLVSDNLDIWTTAIERKSGAGRGNGRRVSLYGIGRLRPLIIELALRGKLTPQQPDDEPVTAVLARLAEARRLKIDSGQARKPKAPKPLPFDLPPLPLGWAWTQLGTIAEISPSNNAPDSLDASFVPMGLVSSRVDGAHNAEIRKWGEIKKGFTHFAEGDIGLAKITPCFENGKAAIFENLANGIGAGTTELHVARPWSEEVNRRFLLLTMKTASYLREGAAGMTGTAGQKRVTRAYFESTALPFPPLAEQKRIVAKVDELMALCDTLECESVAAMTAHQALVETLLRTLAESADAADFADNWSRLAAHFDILFTTEASVDALRATLVELAVRGKLGAQNAADGSAAELLQALEAKKRDLKKIGALRNEKPLPGVSNQETPFSLPDGWLWARIGQLALFTQYGTSQKADKFGSGIPVLAMGNINLGKVEANSDKCIPEDSDELPELFLEPGDLLYNRTNSYELVGKTGLYDGPENTFTFASYLIRIRLAEAFTSPEFVNLVMNSPYFRETQVVPKITKQTGQANVSGSAMRNMLIPLPPRAEQHRIIAKIDELMALCDALKARITDATETQRYLADAIVEMAAG